MAECAQVAEPDPLVTAVGALLKQVTLSAPWVPLPGIRGDLLDAAGVVQALLTLQGKS